MSITVPQVWAQMAQVSVNDILAVRDLHRDTYELTHKLGRTLEGVAFSHAARRVDRLLGQAIRAGQARGEVLSRGQTPTPGKIQVRDLLPAGNTSLTTDVYSLADGVSDAMFVEAVGVVAASDPGHGQPPGMVSRVKLAKLLRLWVAQGVQVTSTAPAFTPAPEPLVLPAPTKKTKRAQRTIEHMAIQVNAIALGCAELDPAEVDTEGMVAVIEQVLEDLGRIRGFIRRARSAA